MQDDEPCKQLMEIRIIARGVCGEFRWHHNIVSIGRFSAIVLNRTIINVRIMVHCTGCMLYFYCILFHSLQAVFVIWVCAYVSLGMALYGSVSHNFSSVATAMQSVTGLLTRHYRFDEMEGTRDFWTTLGWRLFVVSFLLLALGSLTAYVSRLKRAYVTWWICKIKKS